MAISIIMYIPVSQHVTGYLKLATGITPVYMVVVIFRLYLVRYVEIYSTKFYIAS